MGDPLTAISLAANILQFIEFGCKLFSATSKIYVTGGSSEHKHLESIANNLRELSEGIKASERLEGPDVPVAKRLLQHAEDCHSIAEQLSDALKSLNSGERSGRKWKSFVHALKLVWKENDKIRSMQERLENLRAELSTSILETISYRQSYILNEIRRLSKASEELHTSHTSELNSLLEKVSEETVTSIKSLNKENLEQLDKSIQRATGTAVRISKEHSMLRSLQFDMMYARESAIADAHMDTFRWIFSDKSEFKFLPWLERDGGIYWVSGKPGSGKSTLMKYIANHCHTIKGLQLWSGKASLCVASFYFWNAGTAMQKSQQGLLQLLLYQIMSRYPSLIPTLCPNRWQDEGDRLSQLDHWSISELSRCFQRLENITGDNGTKTKFCFFIDGLDEYKGNHSELIKILKNIANIPCVKICVSSRPWPCFADAFGADDKYQLFMQFLTKGDIEKYSRDNLGSSLSTMNMNYISELGRSYYEEIIHDLVSRAQGVFLWVVLVVRSLQEGLSNGDSLSILRARLRKLPTDLEEFFEHIIKSVDDVYHTRMASAFRVALQAEAPLFLMFYVYLEEEFENPSFALGCPCKPVSWQDIIEKEQHAKRQLSGRYKGLLEVVEQSNLTASSYAGSGNTLHKVHRVDFLHRTVRDFLLSGSACDLLVRLSAKSFSPPRAICQAMLAYMKFFPNLGTWTTRISDIAEYAKQFEQETGQTDVVLFNEFDYALRTRCNTDFGYHNDFFGLAISYGLKLYVASKLSSNKQLVRTSKVPYLIIAITSTLMGGSDTVDMVSVLLKAGASPNQHYILETILGWLFSGPELAVYGNNRHVLLSCAELFFRFGGDPTIKTMSHCSIFNLFLKKWWNVSSRRICGHKFWIKLLPHFISAGADLKEAFHENDNSWFDLCLSTHKQSSEPSNDSVHNMCHTAQLLQSFVELGLDPTWRWHDNTVWGAILDLLISRGAFLEPEADEEWCKLILHLLDRGADPNVDLSPAGITGIYSIPDMVDRCFLPNSARQIKVAFDNVIQRYDMSMVSKKREQKQKQKGRRNKKQRHR